MFLQTKGEKSKLFFCGNQQHATDTVYKAFNIPLCLFLILK